jgi:2-polyprenyl-3-methyl-5-hydroxy-6-metoxy-1,4-benzoquinol methylase
MSGNDAAPADAVTPAALAAVARQIYTAGPLLTRLMQHWRPYICPLEQVVNEVPAGAYVLDVGCGGGLLLGAMARMGRIRGGVGVDFSADGIEAAGVMAKSLGGGARLDFRRISAEDTWPEAPYTAVTLVDVMHHVPPPVQREVFQRVSAAVKPGALLIYKDIAQSPKWRMWANTLHDLVIARQWVHYVPLAAIEEWAAADGLRLVRKYRLDRLWYGHEFALFERP